MKNKHDYEKGVNEMNNTSQKSGYSVASLISSSAPIAILIIGFLVCLALSGGKISDNDSGAAWWYFIALIMVFVPMALIGNILSIIFGVMGLKRKRTLFAWAGIIVVLLEVLAAVCFVLWLITIYSYQK